MAYNCEAGDKGGEIEGGGDVETSKAAVHKILSEALVEIKVWSEGGSFDM